MKVYKLVKVRCKKCNDILEFHYENADELGVGHLVKCKCGATMVDPSPMLYRIIGNRDDYEDMSEEM